MRMRKIVGEKNKTRRDFSGGLAQFSLHISDIRSDPLICQLEVRHQHVQSTLENLEIKMLALEYHDMGNGSGTAVSRSRFQRLECRVVGVTSIGNLVFR